MQAWVEEDRKSWTGVGRQVPPKQIDEWHVTDLDIPAAGHHDFGKKPLTSGHALMEYSYGGHRWRRRSGAELVEMIG